MGLPELFGFATHQVTNVELPKIFPLNVIEKDFINLDTQCIYEKILSDCIERTHGIPEDKEQLLWDNCLKSQKNHGLLTMICKALVIKADLFLVYDKSVELVREGTADEKAKIQKDYETKASSSVGVYISFKNFNRVDMVKLYASLEYCCVASLYKGLNVSRSMQFKISELRGSTSLVNSADAKAQAKAMAEALAAGNDIMMDGDDSVGTTVPDMKTVSETIDFLNQKRAFYLGMPASWVTGEQNSTLSDTGKGDTKAVERGLKPYFYAIVKPIIETLLGVKLQFKSQDFDGITAALESIKTFELVGEDIITAQEKRMIVAMQLNLPQENKDLKAAAPDVPVVPPKGNQP